MSQENVDSTHGACGMTPLERVVARLPDGRRVTFDVRRGEANASGFRRTRPWHATGHVTERISENLTAAQGSDQALSGE
jgi:hypothetical protein